MKRTKQYEKVCIMCGGKFIANSALTKLCSDECRRLRNNQNFRKHYHAEKDLYRESAKQVRERSKGLVDMAVEARKHGMTYGEYMVHLYWEEERAKRK